VRELAVRAMLASGNGLLKNLEARQEQLARGSLLKFDQERGYGFIAADDGGDDVFLHASVFDGDSYDLAPGMRVEFKVLAGDRGRKAFAAHVIPDEIEAVRLARPTASAPAVPLTAPAPAVPLTVPVPGPRPVPAAGPVSLPPADQSPPAPGRQSAIKEDLPDDEPMCDVLSPTECVQEVTEILLGDAPTLTGQQIAEVRQGMLEWARKHGWIVI
jgi:cold shock protein